MVRLAVVLHKESQHQNSFSYAACPASTQPLAVSSHAKIAVTSTRPSLEQRPPTHLARLLMKMTRRRRRRLVRCPASELTCFADVVRAGVGRMVLAGVRCSVRDAEVEACSDGCGRRLWG